MDLPELSPEDRIKHMITEGESLARFFVVEAQRQRRSEVAVNVAVGMLADILKIKNPTLWADVEKIVEMRRNKVNADL